MTASLADKARAFHALHQGPEILVLTNAWDVASAKLLEAAGFPAIATTSAGIAYACGFPDGQRIPRDEMLEEVERIVSRVGVPVTADLEAGYGYLPEAVAETIRLAIEVGTVGANIEDYTQDPDDPLFDFELAVERIRAARAAADAAGIDFVLNARTDTYLSAGHKLADPFAETVRRLQAYWEAGARCLYVPAMKDEAEIAMLTRELDGPVNLLGGPGVPPVPRLEALGVARMSTGSGIARAAYGMVRRAVRELTGPGSYDYAREAVTFDELEGLLDG